MGDNTPPQQSEGPLAVTRPLRMIRRWFFWRGKTMPLKSTKIRKLGERVVVEMDVPDDWQPGRIHRVLPAVRKADYEYIVEMESGEYVQVGAHRLGYQMPSREPEIPPEELRRRCLEVQAEWSEQEREKRWCGPKLQPVQIQRIGRTSSAGRMDSDE